MIFPDDKKMEKIAPGGSNFAFQFQTFTHHLLSIELFCAMQSTGRKCYTTTTTKNGLNSAHKYCPTP